MRNLTVAICLSIVVILGSAGMSWSADYQKGVTAYQSGNYATALREWTPLAELGDANAQNGLGRMFDKGQGVPQNHKTAVKWYKLAAEQGYVSAQCNLGHMYKKGQGVPQNYKTAMKWYTLAAMNSPSFITRSISSSGSENSLDITSGNAVAQSSLGAMYAEGQGVPKDYIRAHMWWSIATSSGDKSAVKNVDIVAGKMTPVQIADAEKLARECVAKKYKGC